MDDIRDIETMTMCPYKSSEEITLAVRQLFPFYANASNPKVFLESAGGAQVPQCVIDAIAASLSHRHRARIGAQAKLDAKATLALILGASLDKYSISFGTNATSLLSQLAQEYVRTGRLTSSDEIIICTENHLANVSPWVEAAQAVGATIVWCHVVPMSSSPTSPQAVSSALTDLVTSRTRLVVLSHASNILGELRNISSLKKTIKSLSDGRAQIVVDGVAAVPHVYADLDAMDVDWYVISCHKLFGPHLGVLVGQNNTADGLNLEQGTVNYEACAGVRGLGDYVSKLACLLQGKSNRDEVVPLRRESVKAAYRLIALVERPLCSQLYDLLSRSPNVELLQSHPSTPAERIPVVSFQHSHVSSERIVEACEEGGVIARNGMFLSCGHFRQDFSIEADKGGVVRLSMAHYSLPSDIQRLVKVLEAIPDWN
jgi:selenocysteine lyase/cysteine desulfurase